MPPNARMSLAQQLLIRALIARLWHEPAARAARRAGAPSLHDRFMLPHFVWEDFLDVLRDLRDHGFDLRSDWFEAQAEFRFPFCGEVEYEGVKLELRQALEPWHVMGETGAIGGTVRYVDRSVERLQVKLDRRRSRALRRRLQPAPDAAAGSRDQRRRGRRRALQGLAAGAGAASGVPVNAPLTFDIFDTWTGRALGGCVYHVAHPGGRSYDTFPVNERGRGPPLARFEAHGHTPGAYEPAPETPHAEFPLTLDPPAPGRGLRAVGRGGGSGGAGGGAGA